MLGWVIILSLAWKYAGPIVWGIAFLFFWMDVGATAFVFVIAPKADPEKLRALSFWKRVRVAGKAMALGPFALRKKVWSKLGL